MDTNKVRLLIHTLRYLKIKQVCYRIYYLIRNRLLKKQYNKRLQKNIEPLHWGNDIFFFNSYFEGNIFEFLNLKYQFDTEIDWNFRGFGKLWTYNLNYFDYLNQKNIELNAAVHLILNYIDSDKFLKDGKEPYPISLRGINWIKFLSRHKLSNKKINQALYDHYQLLYHNIEYHLLGNHLLENGFSLLFGAYYFKDDLFYKKAQKILSNELKEQVLSDGAHFELSPMYHQILLHRLLDCINLISSNSWKQYGLLSFLEAKAEKMLSWLQMITYKNGEVPMVNDSAFDIALKPNDLFSYAKNLELHWGESELSDSGYRKIENNCYELFLDVGDIKPPYQPGHAHSDTFSFELYVNNKSIIVDTGVSTYEKNSIRYLERSTSSHNTVQIKDKDQTEVWGGFRVAKRAKIIDLKETQDTVEATHNGYKKMKILHTRKFKAQKDQVTINDDLSKSSNNAAKAYLHFHPKIKRIEQQGNIVKLLDNKIVIKFFKDVKEINIFEYDFPLGYNKKVKSKKVEVLFDRKLKTQIEIH